MSILESEEWAETTTCHLQSFRHRYRLSNDITIDGIFFVNKVDFSTQNGTTSLEQKNQRTNETRDDILAKGVSDLQYFL